MAEASLCLVELASSRARGETRPYARNEASSPYASSRYASSRRGELAMCELTIHELTNVRDGMLAARRARHVRARDMQDYILAARRACNVRAYNLRDCMLAARRARNVRDCPPKLARLWWGRNRPRHPLIWATGLRTVLPALRRADPSQKIDLAKKFRLFSKSQNVSDHNMGKIKGERTRYLTELVRLFAKIARRSRQREMNPIEVHPLPPSATSLADSGFKN